MSELWTPMPLDDEIRQWLESEGVPVPEVSASSRLPTSRELRAVLEALQGYRVIYREKAKGWDAEVVDAQRGYQGPSATIWVKDVADEDTPTNFDLHKPDLELALVILEKLSQLCGPFALVQGSSMRAVVVSPGCDVKRLVSVFD